MQLALFKVAAQRKEAKRIMLSHIFKLFSCGPLSASSHIFISDIGLRITQRTSNNCERIFLFQRISVAIQRFSAVCGLENIFELAYALLK
jgi:hypothetical protein